MPNNICIILISEDRKVKDTFLFFDKLLERKCAEDRKLNCLKWNVLKLAGTASTYFTKNSVAVWFALIFRSQLPLTVFFLNASALHAFFVVFVFWLSLLLLLLLEEVR